MTSRPHRSLARSLEALASEYRLGVVELLAKTGSASPSEIQAALPHLSQPSVSRHLRTLLDRGVVEQSRDLASRNHCGLRYRLAAEALDLVLALRRLANEIEAGIVAEYFPMGVADVAERHRQQTAAAELGAGHTRGSSPQEPPP